MRLKKKFIPAFYLIMVSGIFCSVLLLGRAISKFLPMQEDNDIYRVINIIDDSTVPVSTNFKTKIIKPFISNQVKIYKSFYDSESDAKTQENSLILYKNIYMQNTGVFYTSDDNFEILCVLDGKIKSIENDDILGTVVEVIHENDILSVYQSVSNVIVKEGDEIKQGQKIGESGNNDLTTNKYNLLFEIYYKNNLLNPEKIYDSNLEDILQ